jgi:hypothetical protein
MIPSVD